MAIRALLTLKRFNTFMGNDGHHDQCGYRIGPPPAKEPVEHETAE